MVDECRDTSVWVVLCVLRALVLFLFGIEVYELVFKTELAKNERDFPVNSKAR